MQAPESAATRGGARIPLHCRRLLHSVLPLVILFGCAPPGENEAKWELLDGPYAREIGALLPLANTQGRLVAGMTNGDVYCSTDNGAAWERRVPPDAGNALYALIQHPDTPSCIYACTAGGLFMSRDESRSWRRLPVTDAGSPFPVYTVTHDPWKNRTLFAGTAGRGIYRSTDNGVTWAPVNGTRDSLLREAHVFDIVLDPDRPDRMLVAIGTGGLAISENSARDWRSLIEGRTAVAAAVTHVRLQPGDGSVVVYGTDAGSIYRSGNRGEFWSPSREGSSGDKIRTLTRIPSQPKALLAGTEIGIIQSLDFGESWRPVATPLPPSGISLVLGPGSPPRWYAFGPGIGLRTSTDQGRTWSAIDEHLGGATARIVATDPTTRNLFVAFGSTVLSRSSAADGWTTAMSAMAGGTITSFASDRLQRGTAYLTSAMGAFRTKDNGNSWEPFARQLAMPPTILVAHPWFASRLLCSTPKGNFYSTNNGSTWKESGAFAKTPPARAYTFRPTDAGAVYAAAGTGGILISSDGGITWNATRYGLEQDTIECISLDGTDRSICYAWTQRGRCYRSLNGGLEWDRFAAPWEPEDRALIALDPLSSSDLAALVKEQNLFISKDGGTTWLQIPGPRIPAQPIAIAWDRENQCLVAGTRHGGIYRIDLASSLRARERERE